MLKLNKNQYNKLIGYIDKEFTWETKKNLENGAIMFFNHETKNTIYLHRSSTSLYVNIHHEDKKFFDISIKNFHELTMIKKMVKLIG